MPRPKPQKKEEEKTEAELKEEKLVKEIKDELKKLYDLNDRDEAKMKLHTSLILSLKRTLDKDNEHKGLLFIRHNIKEINDGIIKSGLSTNTKKSYFIRLFSIAQMLYNSKMKVGRKNIILKSDMKKFEKLMEKYRDDANRQLESRA